MSDANDYMTPEQEAHDTADRGHVRVVLEQATADGVSLIAAMQLNEPTETEVVTMWVNRLWDGLRDSLNNEQRLLAIVMLLEPAMSAAALADPYPGGGS